MPHGLTIDDTLPAVRRAPGKYFVPGVHQWPRGKLYHWCNDCHELCIFTDRLTGDHLRRLTYDDLQFSLLERASFLFLRYRWEGGRRWSRAPFCWMLQSRHGHLPHGSSDCLQIIVVEAGTGMVRLVRTVTLPRDFAFELNGAVHRQIARERYPSGRPVDVMQ